LKDNSTCHDVDKYDFNSIKIVGYTGDHIVKATYYNNSNNNNNKDIV